MDVNSALVSLILMSGSKMYTYDLKTKIFENVLKVEITSGGHDRLDAVVQ